MTKNQLQARLVERNSNFRRFALSHGYSPRNVNQAVTRHVGTDRVPRGILTYKILRDLSEFIGEPVIDGIAELTK